MVYTAEEIARDVRVALDLNDVPTQLVLDADIETLTTEEVIRSKIGDAAVRVLSEAPPTLLDGGHGFADSVFWGAGGCGWTLLPSDFLRLIVFEMSDWEKPVTSPISEFDAAYTLQRSRHKGLRGTPQLPVCAVVMRPEGKALEFYACADDTAYVRRALYQPYPKEDEYEGWDIPERCYRAVVYMTAALTAQALGDADKAAVLTQQSSAAMI